MNRWIYGLGILVITVGVGYVIKLHLIKEQAKLPWYVYMACMEYTDPQNLGWMRCHNLAVGVHRGEE